LYAGFGVGEGAEDGVEAVEFERGEAFGGEALGDGLGELLWDIVSWGV